MSLDIVRHFVASVLSSLKNDSDNGNRSDDNGNRNDNDGNNENQKKIADITLSSQGFVTSWPHMLLLYVTGYLLWWTVPPIMGGFIFAWQTCRHRPVQHLIHKLYCRLIQWLPPPPDNNTSSNLTSNPISNPISNSISNPISNPTSNLNPISNLI